MESCSVMSSSFLAILLITLSCTTNAITADHNVSIERDVAQRRTYIIRVRAPKNITISGSEDLTNWYKSFLPPATTESADFQFIYTYSEAIIGFAANLTEDEVWHVEQNDDFLKAYPDRLLRLSTTHTPDFLGLQIDNGLWRRSNMGKGVIIGMIDTGLRPDHPSFRDDGLPPPPSKWKGSCSDPDVHCNNKVIGAKELFDESKKIMFVPHRDDRGHGTSTASTAAGNFVKNASVLGNCNGTAAGIAPHAHLAIYKVCFELGCLPSAVLAGIDEAIKDGVDVLSISMESESQPFDNDVIAIGAFSAIEKGIFVSCAAGNKGPASSSVSNEAPWVLTVAASTMDRQVKAIVKLGDGRELLGESLFQPSDFPSTMIPLVYPRSASADNCDYDSVVPSNVKGKIVACEDSKPWAMLGMMVEKAGGAAIVILNNEIDGDTTFAEAHSLPASHINFVGTSNLKEYVNSAGKPVASISFNGTCLGTSPAPVVASFSSRGPSIQNPGILKPDILGPGVNVLAADRTTNEDPPKPKFSIVFGTSLSTPHLSGIAALIKAAHPDWSPAVIKSAIMTTSDITDNTGNRIMDETLHPASFFDMGAGHVNPTKASEPGLVYDLVVEDYIAFLCGLGYEDKSVEAITHRKVTCSKVKKITEAELNYPSVVADRKLGKLTVNRTVTNVEEGHSTYNIKIDMPKGVSVNVSPATLEFLALKEKMSFTISLSWSPNKITHAEGNFMWVSKKHVVRSPIVICQKIY